MASKQPADADNPFVGRINVHSIAPPHTATSIMKCICSAEGLNYEPVSQLFVNVTAENPIGCEHLSIFGNDRPGLTPEDPMAFVDHLHPEFPQLMKVLAEHNPSDPTWLNITGGEILRTTIQPDKSLCVRAGRKHKYLAYKAINAEGKVGFVSWVYLLPFEQKVGSIHSKYPSVLKMRRHNNGGMFLKYEKDEIIRTNWSKGRYNYFSSWITGHPTYASFVEAMNAEGKVVFIFDRGKTDNQSYDFIL